MGFSQALSGLNAAAQNLDVVGNNIANSQTYGFKGSGVQFADVYTGSDVGQGVRVAAVLQDFSGGTLESTGRNLDLGINGDGFLRFKQDDQVVYSRNGQLTMTPDGYLENASGARLTGFPAGVGTGGQPEVLRIPAEAMPAQATKNISESFNLDASTVPPNPAVPFIDPTTGKPDPDGYDYANTGTVYDSLGVQHTQTTYFTKTGDNEWQVHVAVDGNVATGMDTLTFNSNGTLSNSTSPTYQYTPPGGAAPMEFTVDFTGTTQFGNDFALSSLTQNGWASGTLVGISFDQSGNIIGNYSNEQSQILGTVTLADFRNPEGLKSAGDNVWVESGNSGQPILGIADSGQFGTLEGGTLEASNVDLTQELVDLIVAQRNYQANTQTIKVQDEVLQSAVNLR